MLAFYLPLLVMIIIYINIFRAAAKIKKREAETMMSMPQYHLSSNDNHSAPNVREPLLHGKAAKQRGKNSTCSATNSQYGNGLAIPNSSSSDETHTGMCALFVTPT
jgi:hypothetical protein